jgi:hypothetical protein
VIREGLGDATAEARAGLLIVDDHPVVRAGLVVLLEEQRRLSLLPPAAGTTEALTIAQRGHRRDGCWVSA